VNDAQWLNVKARLTTNWPHQLPPESALAKWRTDLDDLDGDQVEVAIEALYRDGRDFPPNGAQIRAKVVELAADVPTWGEVWDRLWRAAQRFGRGREQEAFGWLEEWSPLAAQFARQLPFREFCTTTEPEVFHGQARRVWEQLVRRFERDTALTGLPSAGLKAVERANKTAPAHIGDAIRNALPAPSASEEAA
jgi:hypothetical protein